MQPFTTPLVNIQNQQAQRRTGVGYARDYSDIDLSGDLRSVSSRGGLNVQFFWMRVQTKSRNARTNGRMETRLCVALQPKGDSKTIATRFITEPQAQREFPIEWAQFKEYQETPTAGTPLHELPGISQSQIALLALHGLRSVEDLAEVPEDVVSQIGYDATQARKIATHWLSRREVNLPLISAAEVQARADIESKTLRDQIAALEHQIAVLSAAQQVQAGATAGAASTGVIEVANEAPTAREVPFEFGPSDVVAGSDDLNAGADPDPLAD
jgi:hypothetical protein